MGTFGINRKWLLVFLVLVLYLPFIDKAFHIDDIGFIEPAREIGWIPLDMKGIDGQDGETAKTPPNPFNSTHSAFLSYWIKIISFLFGEYEISLHMAYLIFPILTVLCIQALYERWYPQGTAVTYFVILMYVAIPAFLVNSHTIMADVPALAFLLLFLSIYFHAEDRKKPIYYYLAGIVLCCAVLSSYQVIFIVLPIGVYAVVKKNISIHVVGALLMPLVLLIGYLVLLYKLHGVILVRFGDFAGSGAGIASEIKRGLMVEVMIGKIANILATIGASLLFVYSFRLTMLRQTGRFFVKFMVASVFSVIPCSVIARSYSLMEKAGFILLVSLGLLIIIEVVRISFKSYDKANRPRYLLLLTWIVSVIGYNVLVMPFGAARYILPALLPMVFLLLDAPPILFAAQCRRSAFVVVVVAAMIFGLSSAYSDYAYAQNYRNFAGEVETFRAAQPSSVTIWYVGRWGMQYYLNKAGCMPLSATATEPRKGDYVIMPEMPRFWEPVPDLIRRLNFYASREYRSNFPLRLFNRRSNAGFYAHFWGLLPFSFSREPDELFQIWEVVS